MENVNKKIGIITYPDIADGKGRFLQAYALYSFLKKQGYDVEIIDYIGLIEETRLQRFIRHIKLLSVNSIKEEIYIRKENLLKKSILEDRIKQRKIYEEFISNNIKVSKRITNFDELKMYSTKFEAIVCGSDQIWNPYYWGKDKAYYGASADNKAKRISYAASIGTCDLSNADINLISTYIREMDSVSVREKSAAELLLKNSQISCEVVVDPTFLLDSNWWNGYSSKRLVEDEYILTFFFDNSDLCRKFSNKLSEEKQVKIINIPENSKDVKSENDKWACLGPCEFASAFRYADYVVTQSFHGVVLSILYRRPFFVLDRSEGFAVNGLMSRITDLLERFGLKNRIITGLEDINSVDVCINYDEVYIEIEKWREESRHYLCDSLGE